MEKEITTLSVYREDVEILKDVMGKNEFFRDKFHEMVKEEIKEKQRRKRK